MATNVPGNLRDFLEAAGQSLSQAQGAIGNGQSEIATNIVIASAELEVKAAVESDEVGNLSLKTLSAEDVRSGNVDPGVLSTLRVSFVAAAPDELQSRTAPKRALDDVVQSVTKREDVARLGEILGGLNVKAAFVPEQRRWLVTAHDNKNRLVREVVVPDELTEG